MTIRAIGEERNRARKFRDGGAHSAQLYDREDCQGERRRLFQH
jgi:hypothetical protein